jgi:hypothetical protein
MEVDILEEDTSQHMVGTFLPMIYRSEKVILAEEDIKFLVVQVNFRFSLKTRNGLR